MPYDETDLRLQKHKKNVLHSERRIAEAAIADGNVVKLGTYDWTVVPATANSQNLGVALNTVTAADIVAFEAGTGDIASVEVEVAMIGVVPVIAGDHVDADDFVVSDGSARVVTITGDGSDEIIGKLLKDASGAGEETHMLIVYIPAVSGRT